MVIQNHADYSNVFLFISKKLLLAKNFLLCHQIFLAKRLDHSWVTTVLKQSDQYKTDNYLYGNFRDYYCVSHLLSFHRQNNPLVDLSLASQGKSMMYQTVCSGYLIKVLSNVPVHLSFLLLAVRVTDNQRLHSRDKEINVIPLREWQHNVTCVKTWAT